MTAIDSGNAITAEHLPVEYIPELLLPIAEEIGPAAIFRLMMEFGGLTIYIAKARDSNFRLFEVLRKKAFKIITSYFQSEKIHIPKLPTGKTMKAVRNKAIRSDWADGATVLSLAKKYGLSDGTIWKIANSPTSEPAVGAASPSVEAGAWA